MACALAAGLAAGCATAPAPMPSTPPAPLTKAEHAQLHFFSAQLAEQQQDWSRAAEGYRMALAADPGSQALRRFLVGALIRDGRFHEAISAYRPLSESQPDDAKSRYILGQLYEAAGDTRVAETFYRAALDAGERDSEPYTTLGILLLKEEKDNEALKFLEQALSIQPRDLEARRTLVKYLLSHERFDEAETLLEEGIRLEPRHLEWLMNAGKLKALRGATDEALAQFETLVSYYPDNLDARRYAAELYLKQEDWKQAAEILGFIVEHDTDDRLSQRNLGLAYLELGRLDEAKTQLYPLTQDGSADGVTHYLMGTIYQRKGLNYLAEHEFREAIRLDPSLPEAYLGLSGALMDIGDAAASLGALETAHSRFPDHPGVMLSYGVLLLRLKHAPAALSVLRQAAAAAPDRADIQFHLGRALLDTGKFDEAVAAWKKTVALDPHYADGYNHLGYVHAERGIHLDQAVAWLQQALALDPLNGFYRDSLGWALYQQKRYRQAAQELEKARDTMKAQGISVDPVIYDHLGDVYFVLQRYAEAEDAWRLACQSDPSNTVLDAKLKKVRQLRSRPAHELSVR